MPVPDIATSSIPLRDAVVAALEDRKGRDIVALDVRASTTVTDFMIIATGTSRTHVRAMVERVLEEADVRRLRPLGVEGRESGEWVLVDLADVVVHVMQEDARGFYDLERLWQPFPESRTEPADPRPAETGAN